MGCLQGLPYERSLEVFASSMPLPSSSCSQGSCNHRLDTHESNPCISHLHRCIIQSLRWGSYYSYLRCHRCMYRFHQLWSSHGCMLYKYLSNCKSRRRRGPRYKAHRYLPRLGSNLQCILYTQRLSKPTQRKTRSSYTLGRLLLI